MPYSPVQCLSNSKIVTVLRGISYALQHQVFHLPNANAEMGNEILHINFVSRRKRSNLFPSPQTYVKYLRGLSPRSEGRSVLVTVDALGMAVERAAIVPVRVGLSALAAHPVIRVASASRSLERMLWTCEFRTHTKRQAQHPIVAKIPWRRCLSLYS